LQQVETGVKLPAILAQPRGVDLDRHPVAPGRLQKPVIQRRAILRRINGKLLAQIHMPENVKKPRLRRLRQALKVSRPHLQRRALLPPGKLRRVVYRPRLRKVMNGPDEIIPGMAPRQFPNPVLAPRQIIHLQPQLDDQLRMIPPRPLDPRHIFAQLAGLHAPVVKVVPRHRPVIGKANFRQTQLPRLRGILPRLAGGMAAERGMHVIICGQNHART